MERHSEPGVRRLHLVNRTTLPNSSPEAAGPRPQTHLQRPLVPVPGLINLSVNSRDSEQATKVLKMKNKLGGVRLPDFKTRY